MTSRRYILLVFFLGLIPFSCDTKYPYYQIDSIEVNAFRDKVLKEMVTPTDIVNSDTVYFAFMYEGKNIAVHGLDLSNSLYAFKKASNGYLGLKDSILQISILSNRLFNGRQPGERLNDLFYYPNYVKTTLEDFRVAVNKARATFPIREGGIPFIIALTKRPNDSLMHKFSIEMNFSSGKKLTSETPVRWKQQ